MQRSNAIKRLRVAELAFIEEGGRVLDGDDEPLMAIRGNFGRLPPELDSRASRADREADTLCDRIQEGSAHGIHLRGPGRPSGGSSP